MIQVVSGSSPSAIGSGTTYSNLLGGLREGISTVPVGDVVPIACTIRNIFLHISAAPGTGASRTFTLMVNDVDTAASFVIADDATFGSFQSPDLSLVAGDWVALRCDEAGGAVSAGFARFSYEVETVGATQAVFFGNGAGALNSYPVKFGGVLAQIAPWSRDIDGAPSSCTNVMPINGTVTGYRIRLRRGLPAGFLSGLFTIYKSTDTGATFVAQNGSGGTPDTRLTLTAAANLSQASTSFSLPVSRGDLLYTRWDCGDADGAQWACSMGVTFTSSVANQWPYCGQVSTLTSSPPGTYAPIFSPRLTGFDSADNGASQSEGGYAHFALSDFILYAENAPGTGDSRTFETTLDTVPQLLAVTVSDSAKIAEDLIHDVQIDFGNTFGLKATQSGSPSSGNISWGFIQDTSDADSGGGEIPGDLPILGEIGPYMVHHWPREIP